MNYKKIIYYSLLFSIASNLSAQKTLFWNAAKLFDGNGHVFKNSSFIVENGKFAKITEGQIDTIGIPVVDLTGKIVYPGFIATNSTIGLSEIESVRGQSDIEEIGENNSNVRTIIAYNTDSEIIPTVRNNGVLMGHICPRGELLAGQSSVVSFAGNNWEDAAYKTDIGIHIYWPVKYKTMNWWEDNNNNLKNENYSKQISTLKKIFDEGKLYAKSQKHSVLNLKLEALKGLFDSTKTLFLHTQYANDAVESIMYFKNLGVKKIVLTGIMQIDGCIETLKDFNIPVILPRLHSLPLQTNYDIYQLFKMPKALFDAGILFCLSYEGDMEAMGTRNLPFVAGTAVAYGLPYNEAVKSISLNCAKILDINNTTGSIEINKDATFFISTGDALDIISNNIINIYIKGTLVSISSKQDELYKKYK